MTSTVPSKKYSKKSFDKDFNNNAAFSYSKNIDELDNKDQKNTTLLYYDERGNVFISSDLDDNLLTLKDNNHIEPGIRISDLLLSDLNPDVADMYMDFPYLYEGQAAIAAVDLSGKEQFHDLDKLTSGYFLLTSSDPDYFAEYDYESTENYELTDFQCDSLKQTQPFAELILKEGTPIENKTIRLKMYRIQSEDTQRNVFGELVNQDMNKFWCELPGGSLVKCQYHVFNPMLTGVAYFPVMEKSTK